MSIEKNFITLKLRRIANGLEIYVQSEKIEEFFKNFSGISGTYFEKEHYSYVFSRITSAGDDLAAFDRAGKEELLYNGIPNLSFLRMVGIAQGVTFTLPGVYSLYTIQKFIERTKEALKIFYRQYLKPVNVELVITTREVET